MSDTFKLQVQNYFNHLYKISVRRSLRTQYIYKKILRQLEIHEIKTLDEFKNLKFVGPKIYQKFEKYLLDKSKKENKSDQVVSEKNIIKSDSLNSNTVDHKNLNTLDHRESNTVNYRNSNTLDYINLNTLDHINPNTVDHRNSNTVNYRDSNTLNHIKKIESNISDYKTELFINTGELKNVNEFEMNKSKENEKSENKFDFSTEENELEKSINEIYITKDVENICNHTDELKKYQKNTAILQCNDSQTGKEILESKFINPESFKNEIPTREIKVKKNKTNDNNTDFGYLPGYNTINYHILRTLSLSDGLCRSQILLSIQIQTDDKANSLYLNSSIKTLLKHELVQKDDKKYFLTKKGNKICNFLFQNEENKNEELTLLIDAREMRSKTDRTFFERNLKNSKTVNLSVGDFLWIKNQRIVNYIIERKKSSDFVSSITDGRFKEQKNRLKSTGIKNLIYLIEGLKIKEQFVLNALMKTKLENFIVIETNDINETISFISQLDSEIRKSINYENNSEILTSISFSDFTNNNLKTKYLTEKNLLISAFLCLKGISYEKAIFLAGIFESFRNLMEMKREKKKELLSSVKINEKSLNQDIVENIVDYFTFDD